MHTASIAALSTKSNLNLARGQISNSARLTAIVGRSGDLPDRPRVREPRWIPRVTSRCDYIRKRLPSAILSLYPQIYSKIIPTTAGGPCQRDRSNGIPHCMDTCCTLPLRQRRSIEVKPPVLIDKRLLYLRLRLLPGDEYD